MCAKSLPQVVDVTCVAASFWNDQRVIEIGFDLIAAEQMLCFFFNSFSNNHSVLVPEFRLECQMC
jgi:hypothetical protein